MTGSTSWGRQLVCKHLKSFKVGGLFIPVPFYYLVTILGIVALIAVPTCKAVGPRRFFQRLGVDFSELVDQFSFSGTFFSRCQDLLYTESEATYICRTCPIARLECSQTSSKGLQVRQYQSIFNISNSPKLIGVTQSI